MINTKEKDTTIVYDPIPIKQDIILKISKNPLTGLALATILTSFFTAFNLMNNQSTLIFIGLIVVTWLSIENGGNDVSRGIAPLVSAGIAKEWVAVVYGTICTLLGGALSIFVSLKLLSLFTEGIIGTNASLTTTIAIAMGAGAALWVSLATRFSLPVSTTHSIVGSVVLVGIIAFGVDNILWLNLIGLVILPLLFSPVLGALFSYGVSRAIQKTEKINNLERHLSWLSSGAICFVRAVNDTPKIVGIGALIIFATVNNPNETQVTNLFILIIASMAIGSLTKGLAVTKLLAHKVTKLDCKTSFSSTISTTFLVMFSSNLGLPVSTTHISTSAIVGAGVTKGKNSVNWHTLKNIALSWVVTLPGAGILGILVYYTLLLL